MNNNVTIYRIGQIGELSVDFRRTVQDSSPGDATQLNFYPTSVVYLGEVLISVVKVMCSKFCYCCCYCRASKIHFVFVANCCCL